MNDQKQQVANEHRGSVMDVSGWYLIGAMEVMQAELSICSLAAQLSSFRKIIEIVAQRFTLYAS